MIISVDGEESFDKIHHLYIIKIHKLRIEGNFLPWYKTFTKNIQQFAVTGEWLNTNKH